MEHTETTLYSEVKFTGRIFTVKEDLVALENGEEARREVVCHNGGVCVAALTDADELLLVRQFRYPYGEVLMELPAGKLELGEDPFAAAIREQLEETGTTGRDYISLGTLYPTPGYCGEVIHMWACRVADMQEQRLDPGEFLDVVKLPLEKAQALVMENKITDAKTQVAILKCAVLVRLGKL